LLNSKPLLNSVADLVAAVAMESEPDRHGNRLSPDDRFRMVDGLRAGQGRWQKSYSSTTGEVLEKQSDGT
jgi:hypothetical protein